MATAGDDNRTVPPYEGRRDSGEAAETGSEREGARVGGATGPVEDETPKAPDPEDTPRGSVASPADEQPAGHTREGEPDEGSTGPAHEPGTPRGEDSGA